MIRRPPRSTQSRSSAASDVYKRQILGRNALGDADDERDPALGRFDDRRGRELRWHHDEGRRGPGRGHGLFDRVEDRDAVDVTPPFAGGDAPDDLGAVVAVAQAMKATLSPGESLDDHLGVLINENTHISSLGVRERDGPE